MLWLVVIVNEKKKDRGSTLFFNVNSKKLDCHAKCVVLEI